MYNMCAKFQGLSLKTRVESGPLGGKHVFSAYIVACNHLVLLQDGVFALCSTYD